MSKDSICLSKEYGVNPSVTSCYYCGEDCGVALFGSGYKKKVGRPVMEGGTRYEEAEAPMRVGVLDMTPCSKCKDLMKQGILFISIKDGSLDGVEEDRRQYELEQDEMPKKYRRPFMPDPYRTGLWMVVKDKAVLRIVNAATGKEIVRRRWTFVPDEVCIRLRLGEAAGMEFKDGKWEKLKA